MYCYIVCIVRCSAVLMWRLKGSPQWPQATSSVSETRQFRKRYCPVFFEKYLNILSRLAKNICNSAPESPSNGDQGHLQRLMAWRKFLDYVTG